MDIHYDFDKAPVDRGSERLDRTDLKNLPRRDVGEGARAGARYYAGSATTARIALVNTVVRAARDGAWDEVLANLLTQLRSDSLAEPLIQMLYARQSWYRSALADAVNTPTKRADKDGKIPPHSAPLSGVNLVGHR